MTSHNHKITYRDPRRFGFLRLLSTHQLNILAPFSTLGPDSFGDSQLNASLFHKRLQYHNIPIKRALLDQKIIAGIGNIYASEALWQARLSPLRLTNTLTLVETDLLLKKNPRRIRTRHSCWWINIAGSCAPEWRHWLLSAFL